MPRVSTDTLCVHVWFVCGVYDMRYTECEVALYWERVLEDYAEPSVSVVADNFTDLFISDPVDPKTEVSHG